VTDEFNLNDYELHIYASDAPWYDGIEILIFGKKLDEYLPKKYKFVLGGSPEIVEAGMKTSATLVISRQEGEALMNQLWYCGLRPSEVGSAGQLQATEKHLEDMRQLVFSPQGAGPDED
jgi:hypothetical protein